MPPPVSISDRPSQITPHIYLGSARHAKNLSLLKSLGITHVLNCTPPKSADPETGCPNYFEKDASAGLSYKRIPVFDNIGEDLLSHLDGAIRFIEQSQHYGKILVHCHKGISRSASVVMAYLMKTNELTIEEATEHVRGLRPVVSPNDAFLRQLATFEETLAAARAAEASQDSRMHSSAADKERIDVLMPACPIEEAHHRVSSQAGREGQLASVNEIEEYSEKAVNGDGQLISSPLKRKLTTDDG